MWLAGDGNGLTAHESEGFVEMMTKMDDGDGCTSL